MVNKELYLVSLRNHKDSYLTLIGKAQWDWILGPRPDFRNSTSILEDLPPEVFAEMQELEEYNELDIAENVPARVTTGSYENDRAMNVFGIPFDSTIEVFKWATKNGVTIVNEYEGVAY